MAQTKHCTELKEGDIVLFNVDTYGDGEKTLHDGNVIQVYSNKVDVCYLDGYKCEYAMIPFEDMVAVYDEAGDEQKFPGYKKARGFDLIP